MARTQTTNAYDAEQKARDEELMPHAAYYAEQLRNLAIALAQSRPWQPGQIFQHLTGGADVLEAASRLFAPTSPRAGEG